MEYKKISISSGWEIKINNFFNFNGKEVVDETDERRKHLNSTILGMVFQDSLVLDLGWYPEGDLEGEYSLELASVDWGKTYLEFNSKDIEEINEVLFSIVLSLSRNEIDITKISLDSLIKSKVNLPELLLLSGWIVKKNLLYFNQVSGDTKLFEATNKKISIQVEKLRIGFEIKIHEKEEVIYSTLLTDYNSIPNVLNTYFKLYLDNLFSHNLKDIFNNQ